MSVKIKGAIPNRSLQCRLLNSLQVIALILLSPEMARSHDDSVSESTGQNSVALITQTL